MSFRSKRQFFLKVSFYRTCSKRALVAISSHIKPLCALFIEMIAILLATYNSARFLTEQIDSVFHQTYTDWVLYVRDDGSCDGTLDIIQTYKKRCPDRIIVLSDNKGTLKSYGNFLELLKMVDANYYMFCDHDDVWLPNKIEMCFERMKSLEAANPNSPIVVHSDMKVVDQNLNVLSESFWKYSRLLPNHISFWELVCCNTVNGCTMLFNTKAKNACSGNEAFCLMHDTLVAQSVAASKGVISSIDIPLVLYRQHTDNVIGAENTKRKFFIKRVFVFGPTVRLNIKTWERASHIQKGSFLLFIWTKLRVTLLRFFQ